MPKKTSAEFQSVTGPLKTGRWTMIVSPIKKTFTKDGVRYYITADKKLWQADIYDQKLVPPKMKIRDSATIDGSELKVAFRNKR